MSIYEDLAQQLLIIRFQSGDQTAFEPLVARHQGALRYFVRRMIVNSATAEDILQDIWFKVFTRLRTLRDPKAFTHWLYRIARNRAYQEIRDRKTYAPLDEEITVPVTDVDSDNFSAEMAPLIHQCLNHLQTEHREILLLRFLEEMSYEEIALVVDCNIGTVKSRIHYAKRALRKKMEEKSHEE